MLAPDEALGLYTGVQVYAMATALIPVPYCTGYKSSLTLNLTERINRNLPVFCEFSTRHRVRATVPFGETNALVTLSHFLSQVWPGVLGTHEVALGLRCCSAAAGRGAAATRIGTRQAGRRGEERDRESERQKQEVAGAGRCGGEEGRMPSRAAVAWRRAMKKKHGRSAHKAGIRAVLFLGLLAIVLTFTAFKHLTGGNAVEGYSRRLQDAGSLSTGPVVNECEDVIGGGIDDGAPVLAFIIWVMLMIWVFLGIAVVCDEHFEGALEVICDQLELSTAVGGATFMAAGSSAPELATSLVAVFTTRDATGLGTILGSAVFNLVAIICLSGIFGAGPYYKLSQGNDPTGVADWAAGHPKTGFKTGLEKINAERKERNQGAISTGGLFLDKRPLARDALFYVVALGMCVIFALTPVGDGWCKDDAHPDGIRRTGDLVADHASCQFNDKPGFVWWEGLILSLCYGVYIHTMIIDEQLMEWMKEKAPHPPHIELYLTQLEKLEADSDDEEGDPEAGEAAPPAAATGGATQSEVQGLMTDPTSQPAPAAPPSPDGAAETAAAGELPVLEVNHEDLKNVEQWSAKRTEQQIKKLEDRIGDLERKLEVVAEHGYDPRGKWEYKAEEEEEEPESCSDWVVEILSKPWKIAFSVTIPSCERDDYQDWEEETVPFSEIPEMYQKQIAKAAAKAGEPEPKAEDKYHKGKHKRARVDLWYAQSKRYVMSFTMCIVWIGITSWAMVSLAAKMGCHLGVGAFSMGLVVLAAGTSIPDALSSIVVAKSGDGDMACANAVGSNVFNIFLGIGLPMMLSEWTWGQPFVVNDGLPVTVSTVMLILITIVMVRSFALCFCRALTHPALVRRD